jgi:ABC-type amino acid transport substrate-binding protein
MFVEQLAGLTWIAANPGHIQVGAEIPPAKFGDKGAGAMFRKEQPELRDAANAALREIYADGTFDEIVAKWFPPGTSIRADGLWTE